MIIPVDIDNFYLVDGVKYSHENPGWHNNKWKQSMKFILIISDTNLQYLPREISNIKLLRFLDLNNNDMSDISAIFNCKKMEIKLKYLGKSNRKV